MTRYEKMMLKMSSLKCPEPYNKAKYEKELKVIGTKKEDKMADKKRKFGVEVSFKGDTTTLEQLFGTKPIMSTEMAKKIWEHIRAKKFEAQKDWQPKVGEKVKFQWVKDKRFYPGEVVKVTGKVYSVKDSGDGTVYKVKRTELLKV